MILRELQFAARSLRKNPAFAAIAVFTIALGIAGASCIFSVANAVLLRPLPYKSPAKLVVAYADLKAKSVTDGEFSTSAFLDIRASTQDAFEELAAVYTGRQTLPGADGSSEAIRYALASSNIFTTLGAKIALGRNFTESDGQPQADPPPGLKPGEQGTASLPVMAILSYEYWQRRYGGSPGVIGQDIRGGAHRGQQIVGVLAPGFQLLFPPRDNVDLNPEVWVVNRLSHHDDWRTGNWLRLIGRLRPNVTIQQAQAQVDSACNRMRGANPALAKNGFRARLEPMQWNLAAQVRPAILVLMGGAIFLLLIACSNVSNLMLARTSARGRELAVRAALGAGKLQLTLRIFLEAVLLSLLGAGFGLAFAWGGIRELVKLAPADLPRLEGVQIDAAVFGFATLASIASAVLFSLAPALSAKRMDLSTVLRGRTAASGRGDALRQLAVSAEVALCFVLLIGFGLIARSFLELQRIDPGFDPHGVLTFRVLGNPQVKWEIFESRMIDKLRTIPGAQQVTASTGLPLSPGKRFRIPWGTREALADASKYNNTDWQIVGRSYFDTLRTHIVEGRGFSRIDLDPGRSVVVDQNFAAKWFPRQRVVGRNILVKMSGQPAVAEIVGVAANQRLLSLAEAGSGQIFLLEGFSGYVGSNWAIRTDGDPSALAPGVRAAVHEVDRDMAIVDLEAMDALVARSRAATRFALFLISVFAGIAALLVAVGLYGVLSAAVRQRTAEIGVRMALGAQPGSILKLVVGQGLRLSALGAGVGILVALGLTRFMESMLVGVQPFDPATFAAVAVVFFALAAFSSWIPARRAAALDPAAALRED